MTVQTLTKEDHEKKRYSCGCEDGKKKKVKKKKGEKRSGNEFFQYSGKKWLFKQGII